MKHFAFLDIDQTLLYIHHDEQGVLKPVGSAYRELYEPLMRRVAAEKGLSSETWADYWLAHAAWTNATLIAARSY
jgi:hypothetical protein